MSLLEFVDEEDGVLVMSLFACELEVESDDKEVCWCLHEVKKRRRWKGLGPLYRLLDWAEFKKEDMKNTDIR